MKKFKLALTRKQIVFLSRSLFNGAKELKTNTKIAHISKKEINDLVEMVTPFHHKNKTVSNCGDKNGLIWL